MSSIIRKVFTYLLLPAAIVGLTYLLVQSIMEPVKFNKHKDYRTEIAVQRLKDIRDLQVAFKNVNAHYASTVDSLIQFYNDGKMKITLQVGSKDDSLAMAHTEQLKKKFRGLKPEQLNQKLHELYLAGEQNLVFQVTSEIPVRDTLFNDRPNFVVDSIAYIPFSGGDSIQMQAGELVGEYSTTAVFEVKMPYKSLLKGLDKQLCVNLIAERDSAKRYPGLKLGDLERADITGNWE